MPGIHNLTIQQAFVTFIGLYMPAQLPLAILEGLVTGAMLTYIAKVRPDILYNLGVLKKPKTGCDI